MTVNIFFDNGECKPLPAPLQHLTIYLELSQNAGEFVAVEVIQCPPGKRVVVLSGRIEGEDESVLRIYNGDAGQGSWGDTPLLLDKLYLPFDTHILPPVDNPDYAHIRTGAGRGLHFWARPIASSSEERLITGYFNYILLDAVPLGDPTWGDMGQGGCFSLPLLIEWPLVAGAENYILQRRQIIAGVAGTWEQAYSGSNAFFEENDLEAGIYEYRFMAQSEDDHSEFSPVATYMVKPNFSLTITCPYPTTYCSVFWGHVPGVAQFKVYRNDVLVATTEYLGIGENLELGNSYTYRVEAHIGAGCFAVAEGEIELVAPCTPPVFSLQLSRDGQEIYLNWGEIAGATQFKIYRNDTLINTLDGACINTGDYVAAISATYTYKVVAYLAADCFGEATGTIDVVIDVFVPFSMDAFNGVNHLHYWRNNQYNKCRMITLEPEAVSNFVPPYLDIIRGVRLFDDNGSGIGLLPSTQPFKLRDETGQPVDMQKLRLIWNYPPNVYMDGVAIPPFWHNLDGDGFHPQALGFVLGTLGNDLALKVEALNLPQNNGLMIVTQRQETWGNAWFYLVEGQGQPFGAMDVDGAVWADGYQGLFPCFGMYYNDKENGLTWMLVGTFPIGTLSPSADGVYISFQVNNPLNDAGNSFGGYQEPCYVTMELFDRDFGTQLAWADYLVNCRVHNINGGRTSIVGGYIRPQAWNSLIQYRQPREGDYLVPTYIEWRHTA